MSTIKKTLVIIITIIITIAILIGIHLQPEKIDASLSGAEDDISFDPNGEKVPLVLAIKQKNEGKGELLFNKRSVQLVNRYLLSTDRNEYCLYPEFKDFTLAVKVINDTCSKTIKRMQKKFILPDFNNDTWPNYYNRIQEYSEIIEKPSQEIEWLQSFFDIAANTRTNRIIIESVNKMTNRKEQTVLKEGIAFLTTVMPDGSTFNQDIKDLTS